MGPLDVTPTLQGGKLSIVCHQDIMRVRIKFRNFKIVDKILSTNNSQLQIVNARITPRLKIGTGSSKQMGKGMHRIAMGREAPGVSHSIMTAQKLNPKNSKPKHTFPKIMNKINHEKERGVIGKRMREMLEGVGLKSFIPLNVHQATIKPSPSTNCTKMIVTPGVRGTRKI